MCRVWSVDFVREPLPDNLMMNSKFANHLREEVVRDADFALQRVNCFAEKAQQGPDSFTVPYHVAIVTYLFAVYVTATEKFELVRRIRRAAEEFVGVAAPNIAALDLNMGAPISQPRVFVRNALCHATYSLESINDTLRIWPQKRPLKSRDVKEWRLGDVLADAKAVHGAIDDTLRSFFERADMLVVRAMHNGQERIVSALPKILLFDSPFPAGPATDSGKEHTSAPVLNMWDFEVLMLVQPYYMATIMRSLTGPDWQLTALEFVRHMCVTATGKLDQLGRLRVEILRDPACRVWNTSPQRASDLVTLLRETELARWYGNPALETVELSVLFPAADVKNFRVLRNAFCHGTWTLNSTKKRLIFWDDDGCLDLSLKDLWESTETTFTRVQRDLSTVLEFSNSDFIRKLHGGGHSNIQRETLCSFY